METPQASKSNEEPQEVQLRPGAAKGRFRRPMTMKFLTDKESFYYKNEISFLTGALFFILILLFIVSWVLFNII